MSIYIIHNECNFRSRFYFLTTIDADVYGSYYWKPFMFSVWFSVISVMIIVNIGLWTIQRCDGSKGIESFIITFGVFCQQGQVPEKYALCFREWKIEFNFRIGSNAGLNVGKMLISCSFFDFTHSLYLLHIRFCFNSSKSWLKKQNKFGYWLSWKSIESWFGRYSIHARFLECELHRFICSFIHQFVWLFSFIKMHLFISFGFSRNGHINIIKMWDKLRAFYFLWAISPWRK